MPDRVTSTGAIQAMLRNAQTRYSETKTRSRIHRMLVERDLTAYKHANYTGTLLPDPFSRSVVALRHIIGQPAQAAIHYASRFSANPPVPEVIPISVKDEVSAKLDKLAGEQEMFDAQLLDEMDIRDRQWSMGMAQALTDAGYYVVMPRDLAFGVPTRDYYEGEEAEILRREGKLAPAPVERSGRTVYAEHADAWEARKRDAAKRRAVNGLSLFTLDVYPSDQVYTWKDTDGIKAAAIIIEIPANECGPGSDIAMSFARKNKIPEDDVGLYGLWADEKGNIVGGIERGGPPHTGWNRTGYWTLVKFFTRLEAVYLVSLSGSYEGATEVYRCKHGAKKQGVPSCPVVEVPCMRLDTSVAGHEFIGPMSTIFALAPAIDQMMTLLSNAGVFNGIPRWVVELPDGSILRDDTGKPVIVESAAVPGLDPSEAAAYPGTLRQLVIDTSTLEKLLPIYLEQLEKAMPSPAATGNSGDQSAAWLAQTNIQQHQLTLQQPIENHRRGVRDILLMCHEWLRTLDTPVYFFRSPGRRGADRAGKGLIEFNPVDLTDSITVNQSLDTPDERIVRIQTGLDLRERGVINDRTYFEEWQREQDAREAEIEMWTQKFVNIAMMGSLAGIPEDSLLFQMVQQVKGQVHYAMLEQSPQYALNTARSMAQQAQMQAQQAQAEQAAMMQPPMQGEGPSVAENAGIRRPGMGMAETLQGQLGARAQPLPPDIGAV